MPARFCLAARVLLLSVTLGLCGCGKKAPECRLLIETINPQVEKQQAISQRKIENMNDIEAVTADISSVASETARKLSQLHLTTPELLKFSVDYQTMQKQFAAFAAAAADGIKAGSPDVMKKIVAFDTSVDAAAKREADLIEGMNKFCSN